MCHSIQNIVYLYLLGQFCTKILPYENILATLQYRWTAQQITVRVLAWSHLPVKQLLTFLWFWCVTLSVEREIYSVNLTMCSIKIFSSKTFSSSECFGRERVNHTLTQQWNISTKLIQSYNLPNWPFAWTNAYHVTLANRKTYSPLRDIWIGECLG